MTNAEWLDWIAKGIVPVVTSCVTTAALIVTIRTSGRTFRQQQDQLAHQRERDRRDAAEDEKQRRREAFSSFFVAVTNQAQGLIVHQQSLEAARQAPTMHASGQITEEELRALQEKLIADVKEAHEQTRELSKTYTMWRCVFPKKYISPKFEPLWQKMAEASRETLHDGTPWTPEQWRTLSYMTKDWHDDQIDIILRTGEA